MCVVKLDCMFVLGWCGSVIKGGCLIGCMLEGGCMVRYVGQKVFGINT